MSPVKDFIGDTDVFTINNVTNIMEEKVSKGE
jgi:hypothetical protein